MRNVVEFQKKDTLDILLSKKEELCNQIVEVDNQILDIIITTITDAINEQLTNKSVNARTKKNLIKLNPQSDIIIWHELNDVSYEIVNNEKIYDKYLYDTLCDLEEDGIMQCADFEDE